MAELASVGYDVRELPARFGAYAPPGGTAPRALWLARAVSDAFARARAARAWGADVCFVQRQLVATLCTAEPSLDAPIVLDVDDAIFAGPRGRNAERIASRASLALCGNAFLAEHFGRFCEVAVLPTAVDDERYTPAAALPFDPPVIGWSGTSSGFGYLASIAPALAEVMRMHPQARLRIVSDRPPTLDGLEPSRWSFERWSPGIEVDVIRSFTLGLMPLDDSVWSRGKCSFKMLTYMACGVPAVVSPVGMNAEVLAIGDHGPCALGAVGRDGWIEAIDALLRSPARAAAIGASGRRVVGEHFSRRVVAPRLAALLRGAAHSRQ